MASGTKLKEMIEEIRRALEKLLKRVEGNEELEMSWWRIGADVFLLPFKEGECHEDQIVVEEQSSLQSGLPAVQGYSAG